MTVGDRIEKAFSSNILMSNDITHVENSRLRIQAIVEEFKKEVRELIANYMRSEGCSCCSDSEAHYINKKLLGELLDCGKYDGEDDYNFHQYATK